MPLINIMIHNFSHLNGIQYVFLNNRCNQNLKTQPETNQKHVMLHLFNRARNQVAKHNIKRLPDPVRGLGED